MEERFKDTKIGGWTIGYTIKCERSGGNTYYLTLQTQEKCEVGSKVIEDILATYTTTTTTATTTTSSSSTATTATATTATASTTSASTTTATQTTTTATPCGPGEYLKPAGEYQRYSKCQKCSYGTFREDAYPHFIGACSAWTRCESHEFQISQANATNNYVCQTHTECAAGEYESKRPHPGSRDRQCTPTTPCVAGQYVYREQTANRDRICRNCDNSVASFAGGRCTTTTATSTTATSVTQTSKTVTTETLTTTSATATTATTSTITTTTVTVTTTTIPVAVLKEQGMTAKELWRTHDASTTDLAGAGFTVAEVADAGAEVEAIAAAAAIFEDTTDATAADFQAVRGMTADLLKDEGYGAFDLLKGGFTVAQLTDAGYAASIVAAASTAYADSIETPNAGTNTGTVVAVAVVFILLVVIAAAFIVHKKNSFGNGGDGLQTGFDNPMYDSNLPAGAITDTSPHASSGYMDVPAAGNGDGHDGAGSGFNGGGSSSGYMDVSGVGAGGTAGYMDVSGVGAGGTAGYMDVDAAGGGQTTGYMEMAPARPEEAFATGFDESDEEEV